LLHVYNLAIAELTEHDTRLLGLLNDSKVLKLTDNSRLHSIGFSYFCPSCGKVLRPGECRKHKKHGPLYELLCPDCGSRVLLSGAPILVLGLVILFVSVVVIGVGGEGLPLLGFVVAALGLGLCLIALMRARLVRRLTCGNATTQRSGKLG
jgi:DNA-directed RNA polymerase subunit RPC12/RpoP